MPDDDFEDESPVISDLRKKAERADKAESQAAEAIKKLAIYEAGFGHLNDSQRKALAGEVDGDLTPEALQKAAESLGFPTTAPAPTQDPDPGVSPEEQAALDRVAAATSAGTPSGAEAKTLNDEILAATSPEQITEILERAGRLATND